MYAKGHKVEKERAILIESNAYLNFYNIIVRIFNI